MSIIGESFSFRIQKWEEKMDAKHSVEIIWKYEYIYNMYTPYSIFINTIYKYISMYICIYYNNQTFSESGRKTGKALEK